MLGSRVSFVPGKAVTWVLGVGLFHQPVPGDLCHDGGGGYGEAEAVTPDRGLEWETTFGEFDIIY